MKIKLKLNTSSEESELDEGGSTSKAGPKAAKPAKEKQSDSEEESEPSSSEDESATPSKSTLLVIATPF